MKRAIHPTAVVADDVELGAGVEIGPYSVIGAGTRVGDGTRIGAQVLIDGRVRIGAENVLGPKVNIVGHTTLGDRNVVHGLASLGDEPQDLSYRGEPTELVIGSRNTIREFVTINRGTVKGGGVTRVGDDCLLMACCHVAHDCDVRDRVILANGALLAGHCLVEERANVSGATASHHFVTIGAFCYVGGMTRMIHDIPPFMIVEGHPSRVRGVNVIGLQRAGFDKDAVDALREAHRRLYRGDEPRQHVVEELDRADGLHPRVRQLVDALIATAKGSKGRFRETQKERFQAEGRARILGEGSAR